MKALLRVDDKKELSNPPRVQEKELKEPERISLRTPKELELKETELVSVFFRLEFGLSILVIYNFLDEFFINNYPYYFFSIYSV